MLLAAVTSSLSMGAAYFLHGTLIPRSQLWGNVIWRGPRDRPAVALTFDDGPTPGGTDAILDILQDAGALATFFVIGQNIERHPKLLRRIHESGHGIGNHTWNHFHHGWLGSRGYWETEIRRTDDLIEQTIGIRPIFFRPPVGIKTCLTLAAARGLGHKTINWSVRGRDGIGTNAAAILERMSNVRSGDIVLLHDGTSPNYPRDPAATIDALPQLLQQLRSRELKAVRLDELLNVPRAGVAG